ncbi:MAG: chemotaxis protein CheX [Planctomycetota bacterium]|nr:chemotaxis protein CheX [Planctomycetota bacterium]MCX8040314.1 chemotaxis protein CheX [Planctomycetota bacterium]MDW8373372.1 chemotaxis protein CheX [Planctomycetota bacterium]
MAGLNVDYINPFIEATVNTFTTMCNVTPSREKVFLKGEGEEVYGVSGIIGLGGEAVGAVVLNFPEQVAIAAVSKFVGEEYTSLNSAVVDGVGELTNIIAGDAKNRLIQKGYKFEIGLPKMVTGRNYITAQNKSVPCIVISFTSQIGKFCLEVSLRKAT